MNGPALTPLSADGWTRPYSERARELSRRLQRWLMSSSWFRLTFLSFSSLKGHRSVAACPRDPGLLRPAGRSRSFKKRLSYRLIDENDSAVGHSPQLDPCPVEDGVVCDADGPRVRQETNRLEKLAI